MLKLDLSTQFKKDLKKISKQGKDKAKLDAVINILQNEDVLPKKFRDHDLVGNWKGYRECHIAPDWLLILKFAKAASDYLDWLGRVLILSYLKNNLLRGGPLTHVP